MKRHSALAVVAVLLLAAVQTSAQDVLSTTKIYVGSAPCALSTGSGAPSGGSVCDAYLDTATGQFWTKLSSGWSSVLGSSESAHTVLAGPSSGGAAAPTFRSLVAGDIPSTLNAEAFAGAITPTLTDTYDIGTASLLWRQAYISQMNAVLFAKQTETLTGGWFTVSKNAGVLAAAVASADTSVDFGQAMTANQFVLIRAGDTGGTITEEYFKIGTLVSGTRYNVTRNLSGVGAKNWALGTPYEVRGVAGDGWIDLEAFDTPRMSIWSQGSAYNNSTELIRIGHLSGMPNSASGIGIYAGNSTNYFEWDGTHFKVVSAGIQLDDTGLFISPIAASGGGTFANTNAVRWTTDTTYRTAVWRSDDSGASFDKILNIDQYGGTSDSSGTVFSQVQITGSENDAGAVNTARALIRGGNTYAEARMNASYNGNSGPYPVLDLLDQTSPTAFLGIGTFSVTQTTAGTSISKGLTVASTGSTLTGDMHITGTLSFDGNAISSTATGGGLGAGFSVANFVSVTINGTSYKIALYNP